jgi:hypothetical protein
MHISLVLSAEGIGDSKETLPVMVKCDFAQMISNIRSPPLFFLTLNVSESTERIKMNKSPTRHVPRPVPERRQHV